MEISKHEKSSWQILSYKIKTEETSNIRAWVEIRTQQDSKLCPKIMRGRFEKNHDSRKPIQVYLIIHVIPDNSYFNYNLILIVPAKFRLIFLFYYIDLDDFLLIFNGFK